MSCWWVQRHCAGCSVLGTAPQGWVQEGSRGSTGLSYLQGHVLGSSPITGVLLAHRALW